MDNIVMKIEELDKYQIDWAELQKNEYQVSFDDKYGDALIELIAGLRTLLKKSSLEECINKLNKPLNKYSWFDGILDYANKSLGHYRRLGALRELNKTGKELTVSFLDLAFDNYIMRWNPEFINAWEQFGMKNESEMWKVLKTISFLTDFYVSNCYAKTAIKKDFLGESGLCEDVCTCYSELVDRNYMELKINLIFNRMREME